MTREEEILCFNMQRVSSLLRGQIIGIYTTVEYLIDDINIKLTFNSIDDYNFYIKLLGIRKIDGKTKLKIFKHCLDKYEKLFNKDTSRIKDIVSNVTDKRHVLAHWQLDSSPEGINVFKEKNKIQFIKTENGVYKFCSFNFDITSKLEKDIQEVAVFLIQVQKDLISLHNNQS